MLDRRRFNAVLAGTAGWVALGPIGTAAAQRQSRGAVYASVDARLYRIRQDGNTLTREARPLILRIPLIVIAGSGDCDHGFR